jgi:hypothetical protein
MIAVFTRARNEIAFFTESENGFGPVAVFEAANNVDSRSEGIFPPGCYTDIALLPKDQGSHESIGPWFLWIQGVRGRTEMGMHAGQEGRSDGKGRSGVLYCTMGCIRVLLECMLWLKRRWTAGDQITHFIVR